MVEKQAELISKIYWLRSVGMRDVKPGQYILGKNFMLSEEYIKKTSLKELKEMYEKNKDLIKLTD